MVEEALVPAECSCCHKEPPLPQYHSLRYRRTGFCSTDCRRRYEGRRDKYRRRRRVLAWLTSYPQGVLEGSISADDLLVLNELRRSKLVSREHGHQGAYWQLTVAGRQTSGIHLT